MKEIKDILSNICSRILTPRPPQYFGGISQNIPKPNTKQIVFEILVEQCSTVSSELTTKQIISL